MKKEKPIKIRISRYDNGSKNKREDKKIKKLDLDEMIKRKDAEEGGFSVTKRIKSLESMIEKIKRENKDYEIKDLKEDRTRGKNVLKKQEGSNFWLKISKFCLYILIFLLPLFFLPFTSYPVETNKQILSIFLISLSLIFYLVYCLENKKFFYPKSLLAIAVLVLLFVFGVSTAFSKAKFVSLFGNFVQSDSLVVFLISSIAFWLAAVLVEKKDLWKIGFSFFVSLALVVGIGLLQLFRYYIFPSLAGNSVGDLGFTKQSNFNTLGSPLNWGIFIAFALVLIVLILINTRLSLVYKVVLEAAALIIIAALIVLNYPILWLAIALVMIVLASYCFASFSRVSFPLTILVISLFFALFGSSLPTLVNISPQVRPSLSSTLVVAKETLRPRADQSPLENGKRALFGLGTSTFEYAFAAYRPNGPSEMESGNERFAQGFSFITTLPTTAGVLGVFAILFLIFSFLREIVKNLKDRDRLIISGGILFLIALWFFYPAFLTQFIFIFVGLGIVVSGSRKEVDLTVSSKRRAFVSFLAFVVLMTGSLALSYFTAQKYLGAVYYERANRAYARSGNINESLAKFEKAAKLDPYSDKYQRALSQVLFFQAEEARKNLTNLPETSKEIQSKGVKDTISRSIKVARRATDLNPLDSLNWANLASIYERIIPIAKGADSFAVKNYKRAIQADPKNPQLYLSLSRTLVTVADYKKNKGEKEEVWKKDLKEAEDFLKKAIELKPRYAEAYSMQAEIYIREGRTQEAIEKLKEAESFAPFDAKLAFQLGVIYYNNKRFIEAKSEFEKAVELDGNYSNALYSLGLVYDRLGDKQKAIEQFEKVARLNPDNMEVKMILNNLRSGKSAFKEGTGTASSK